MTVPTTALTAATAEEMTRLELQRRPRVGLLTTRQNAAGPSSAACQTTAASGMSTMTLRYSVTRPTPSQVLPTLGGGAPSAARPRGSVLGRALTATAGY